MLGDLMPTSVHALVVLVFCFVFELRPVNHLVHLLVDQHPVKPSVNALCSLFRCFFSSNQLG